MRGIVIVLCAYVWFLIGLGVFRGVAPEAVDSAFHLAVSPHWRAAAWWFSTLVAIIFAWRRTSFIALGVLVIMPVIKILSYGWAWIVYLIPGPPPGYPNGWYSVAFHIALVAIVVLAAVIPEGLTVRDLRRPRADPFTPPEEADE